MKKGNKNKLAFIKLIASDNIILHAFEIINHIETIPPEIHSGYPENRYTGRSTITLQIEKRKVQDE